ncbi:MAG: hypothetical protein QM765_09390 [Myxococcales bacterium]
MKLVVRNPNCAEQTANLIDWGANPTWSLQDASDEDVPKDEQPALGRIRLSQAAVVWKRLGL